MIPEYLFGIFFFGFVAGLACGAILHAGMEDRDEPERSWSPGWYECWQYKREIKKVPIEKHEREGRELNAFLDAVGFIDDMREAKLT